MTISGTLHAPGSQPRGRKQSEPESAGRDCLGALSRRVGPRPAAATLSPCPQRKGEGLALGGHTQMWEQKTWVCTPAA